ncbi:MAG: polyprenyl synthetase family protein [Clostridia bacterium]|nr:polyprenyl synthetase family protein [Clostridia bacterium]
MNFDNKFNNYVESFNLYLDNFLTTLDKEAPQLLVDSIKYSVKNGGKRVRPTLLFASAEICGVEPIKLINYALAIEFIHSYSLVHDDLPAMDNDDFRRGQLSTHKKFGEDIGILAGDALLNLAMEICLSKQDFGLNDVKATKLLFEYAGFSGMIGGQVLDLNNNSNNTQAGKEFLYSVYLNKTCKLLTAPLLIPSIISGGKYYDKLKSFGENFGYTFQIIDDILDVTSSLQTLGKTPNKDEQTNKCTSVKLFGLDGAKKLAKEHYDLTIQALDGIENCDFLLQFAKKFLERKY